MGSVYEIKIEHNIENLHFNHISLILATVYTYQRCRSYVSLFIISDDFPLNKTLPQSHVIGQYTTTQQTLLHR